jgi:hypothetical protein
MVHFEFGQESLFLLRYSATALAELSARANIQILFACREPLDLDSMRGRNRLYGDSARAPTSGRVWWVPIVGRVAIHF